MPNGHDKNWVRFCSTIDGFRARYHAWPTKVRVMPDILADIQSSLLSADSLRVLETKIKLLECVESLIAEDESGRQYVYGSDEVSGAERDIYARDWLGVTPTETDEGQYYSFGGGAGQSSNSREDTGDLNPTATIGGAVKFTPINYELLNARQKENYNFQKLSAVLADFGFTTIRLNDDWQGADFIAQHLNNQTFLPVQLKGRLHFRAAYQGKGLYCAFFEKPYWYLYPHDEVLARVQARKPKMRNTVSWRERGGYSYRRLDPILVDVLTPYRIPKQIAPSEEPLDVPTEIGGDRGMSSEEE